MIIAMTDVINPAFPQKMTIKMTHRLEMVEKIPANI